MNIQRSSFYAWKKKLAHPSTRMKSLLSNILLFKEYHAKFPSHGYRWLNAKIRLDTGLVLSDAYAHKCCKITGIKSQAKPSIINTKSQEIHTVFFLICL